MASVDGILKLIEQGAGADDLLEGTISVTSPDLYRAGIKEHESWDGALAASLVYVVRTSMGTTAAERHAATVIVNDVERPERSVGNSAHYALHVITRSGLVMNLELDDVWATPTPSLRPFLDGPTGEHRMERLFLGGDDTAMVLITTLGKGVNVDYRLLPTWEREALTRPIAHRFGDMATGEVAACVLPRRKLRDADRFYSVSVFGQIKASDTSEYKRLSADAMPAVLIKDNDALLEVFAGSARTHVFMGSSSGKGIVFPTAEIRSQGRKATGVRGLQLDPDARVIGAFDTAGEGWTILATERGLFKRMSLEEFRPQKRGGGGLQTCRLSADDHVASMCAAPIDGDVIVITSTGRVARFPTYDVPFGSRAAKGEPLFELGEDERIEQVLGVPAGNWLPS